MQYPTSHLQGIAKRENEKDALEYSALKSLDHKQKKNKALQNLSNIEKLTVYNSVKTKAIRTHLKHI